VGTILLLIGVAAAGGIVWWLVRRAQTDLLAGMPLSVSSHEVAADNPSFEAGGVRFVEVARSESGRFLAGRTEPTAKGRGTVTTVGFADLRYGKMEWSAKLKLANHPMVTNDGIVVVEELVSDNSQATSLVAFGRNGRPAWRQDFQARIFSTGLSRDGSQVYAPTGDSRNALHSGKTFVYNVRTGKLARHFTGWQDVIYGGKFPGET